MGNIGKFSSYTPEHRKAADAESAKANTKRDIKLEAGRTIVRFCPQPADWGPVYVIGHIHWLNFGPRAWLSFPCPRLMAKKKCEECEYENQLSASGNKQDEDEAYKRQPQMTIYTNVIRRIAGSDDAELVQIISFNANTLQKFNDVIDQYGDPWDLEEGYDVSFFIPEGKNQKDVVVSAAGDGKKSPPGTAKPLSPDGLWTRQLKPLARKIVVPSPAEVSMYMQGKDPRKESGAQQRVGAPPGGNNRALPGRRNIEVDLDEEDGD